MCILRLAAAAVTAGLCLAQTGEVEKLLQAAQTEYSRGSYEEALGRLESAWKLVDTLPPRDELRYRALRQLASSHAALKQWDQAESHLQLAIHWKEQTTRDLIALNDEMTELAVFAGARGDPERAIEILHRLAAAHLRGGPSNAGYTAAATIHLHMARIHLDAKDPEKALSANRTALWFLEQAHGKDHANLLGVLDAIAELQITARDYPAAEQAYRRALVIRERVHGPDHANLLPTLDGLAYACFGQQKYEEAEPLYQRLLGLWELSSGEFHPMVAVTLDKMAVFYRVQDKHEEARRAASHSVAVRAHFLASRLLEEAHLRLPADRAQAEALLRQALAALDPNEPRTLPLREQIAGQMEALTGTTAEPTRQKRGPTQMRKRKKA
jgi:tetratricopeptide (TPR) repeat protein